MIPMPFQSDGPDLVSLKELLNEHKDKQVIGSVPRFTNPTGLVYSDQNVREMFSLLKKRSNNLMILWDNAYACHDLKSTESQLPIFGMAEEYDLQDNLFVIGSTSKITLAGSGIAFFSSSQINNNKFISLASSSMNLNLFVWMMNDCRAKDFIFLILFNDCRQEAGGC